MRRSLAATAVTGIALAATATTLAVSGLTTTGSHSTEMKVLVAPAASPSTVRAIRGVLAGNPEVRSFRLVTTWSPSRSSTPPAGYPSLLPCILPRCDTRQTSTVQALRDSVHYFDVIPANPKNDRHLADTLREQPGVLKVSSS